MTRIKRQLSDDILGNEKTKQLRSEFSINKKENNSVNCIENLSNELLFEIFDYLEGYSLYAAFSNLNKRFHHLLTISLLRLKIILTSNSQSILEYYSKYFILPNKHQIISFHFNNTINKSSIFLWFPIDSSFNNLESLTLNNIQSNELVLILVGLIHLPRLFSLNIHLDQFLEDLSFVYQLIFNLPKLKYNKLSSSVSKTNISSLTTIRSQFSPIERLIIDHSCTLNDLLTIISYTPRLTHLICKQSLKSNRNTKKIKPMISSKLTHLSIYFGYISFNEFERFIKKISPQLQVLKLYSNIDPAYLNANRWEELIQQYIPRLYKLNFIYMEIINEQLKITPYHKRIHRFNSSFWVKKQWLFHLEIRTCVQLNTSFVYKISPRRHRSSESSIVYRPLSILNLSIMNNKKFFDLIRPILLFSSINVMNIQCNEIFIGTLTELIRLLPNLDVLVVNCSILMRLKCASIEEVARFSDASINNRITKLVLQQMTELAQVQFFIRLCPQMQHLEIFCSNDIEPESLLRFIFMKNINYILNINSISIWISKLNEELHKINYLEELRRDYLIKKEDNRISLRRNK